MWWFSSLGRAGGGRFDLPAPEGTCYLGDTLDGALGEKLLRRPKRIVAEARLRELFHARVAVRQGPPLADLTSKRATGWGVNAEIHTALDYQKPRAWAEKLRAAGARGLRYRVRSDPSLADRGVALFGATGLHARAPAGMRTAVRPLDLRRARTLLEARGVLVLPIPREVAVVPPPKA